MALKRTTIDVKNIHTHTSGLLVATMTRLSFHSLILCIHFETGPITIYIYFAPSLLLSLGLRRVISGLSDYGQLVNDLTQT